MALLIKRLRTIAACDEEPGVGRGDIQGEKQKTIRDSVEQLRATFAYIKEAELTSWGRVANSVSARSSFCCRRGCLGGEDSTWHFRERYGPGRGNYGALEDTQSFHYLETGSWSRHSEGVGTLWQLLGTPYHCCLHSEGLSGTLKGRWESKEELEINADCVETAGGDIQSCLLYTSPSPRDIRTSRMPSSA